MIVVDVEATDLDPRTGSLVSIGALDFTNPSRQFYGECRAWEGATISDDSLLINGFSREDIADTAKKSEAELIAEFVAWLATFEDRVLAGHNTWFDREYLQNAARRAGLSWYAGHRIVDLHSLAWLELVRQGESAVLKADGTSALDSGAVFRLVGLPLEPKPHQALTGAKMEAEAFSRLLFHKGLLEEFAQYPTNLKK